MSRRTSALQPFSSSDAEGFVGLLDPHLDLHSLKSPLRQVPFRALQASKNEASQRKFIKHFNQSCFSINHPLDSLSCIQTRATLKI